MSEPLPPIEVGTSDGATIEVPRSGVYIGNVSNGKHSTVFTRSLTGVVDFDLRHQLGLHRGTLYQESGANISKGRNEMVQHFLATDDGEWLLMVDSDMEFPPEVILRLLACSVVTGAPMVGGLCVFVGALGPIPTLYQYRSHDAITGVQFDYPDGTQLQVAATGAACLMVHRSVFESYRTKQETDRDWLLIQRLDGDPMLMQLIERDMVREPSVEFGWFQERVRIKRTETVDSVNVSEHWMGEDIDFCLRMGDLGARIFVDCSLEIGHAKHGRIWYPRDIRAGIGVPKPPIVAVIAVKNRLDLTSELIHQLRSQGDASEIIVVDNGSAAKTRNWLASQDDLTVLDGSGMGLHAMYNRALEHALEHHGPRTHIAFLNNDLRLGPAFLRTLSQALTDHRELTAVCGNYDGRRPEVAITETTDICAARYDGSGGFAAFACMVRGEWFSTGYRWPEECMWWFGDNDLVASIARADSHRGYDDRPSKAGIVTAAHVEHLDGGGRTAGDAAWSKFREQTDLDRQAYEAKWSEIVEADRNTERVRAGDYEPLYEHLLTQDEHLAVLHDLAVKLDARKVIGLGVRSGATAVAWLAALQRTGGRLWAVDTAPIPPTVSAHTHCTTIQADNLVSGVLAQVPSDADIVLIDTDSTPERTTAEIETYANRVRPGGCVVVASDNEAAGKWAETEGLAVDHGHEGLVVVWLPELAS